MIVIIDSDGLIGSLNSNDLHFAASRRILNKLEENEATIIYPATVIAEAVTFLQGRLNQPKLAHEILRLISNNQISIEPVDNQILQKACLLMDIKNSKHHTLFDCIVAVIADKYQADAIFSFDKFYQKKGFKLAQEL